MGWERRKASESGGFLYQPVPSFAWNPNWCLHPGHFPNGLPWTTDTQKWELRAEGRECIRWLSPHSCLTLDKFSHGSWIPSHFWGVVWLSWKPENTSGSAPGEFSRTSKFQSPLTLSGQSLMKYHFLNNVSLMGSSPLTGCQRCERSLPRQNLYPGCSVCASGTRSLHIRNTHSSFMWLHWSYNSLGLELRSSTLYHIPLGLTVKH